MNNLVFFNNVSNEDRIASLTATAPRLPPITIMIGLLAVKPHIFKPANLSPSRSSLRIGEPVSNALPLGDNWQFQESYDIL